MAINGREPASTETRVSTGIAGLDDVLEGGLPRHHMYLVEGAPGSGKTTLGLQFLLQGAKEGEKGLYVTLSESKDELVGVAASHGWSLDPIEIFEITPQVEEMRAEAQYTVFHPSEVELADTTTSILKYVEKVQPTRVVFDSLSEIRMLARDPLRYRRQILTLKRYFTGRNCTVLLLDDLTGSNDLQVQSISHGVIVMQSLDREYGVKRRRLEVRKVRGSHFREGFHDYVIERGGVVVFPRLVAAEHNPDLPRNLVLSGLEELDDLLGGGIESGTSTIMTGPAGTGKSTLAMLYAAAASARGEYAAIFTFDESLRTLIQRGEGVGIPVKKHLEAGRLTIQQLDPAELSPGEFVSWVRQLVEKNRVKVLVIDSLNGFLNAMPGEQVLVMQMHEMLAYLNQQGVATILTLAQHGLVGSTITGPVDLSYLADSVLLFRYFEAAGEIKKAVSVLKKRSGMHERTIRELSFSAGRIEVGLPLEKFEGVLTGTPIYRGNVEALATSADTQK